MAVVRNPKTLSKEVRTFVADLANSDSVTLPSAIGGADAVTSGLGTRSAADIMGDGVTQGSENLLPARCRMRASHPGSWTHDAMSFRLSAQSSRDHVPACAWRR